MSVRKSLAWSMFGRYAVTGLGFLSSMILARLLTPAEVGVYSVAYSLVSVLQALREFGTSSYLIQERELTEERIRSACGVTIVMGWGLGLIVLALSEPLRVWYAQPDLGVMLRILSLNCFLWPIGAPLMALLNREMRFDIGSRISIAASATQVVVSVGLVLLGCSYYGLAWGAVSETLCSVLLTTFYSPGRTWMRPSFSEWRHVATFGWRAALTGILFSLSASSTDLVIGRIRGFSAAGIFSRASGLTNMLFSRLWGGASTVVMSEFARRNRQTESLIDGYNRAIALLTGIAWPVLAVLSISAFPVVRLLFGTQWDDSVILVRILCVAAMVDTLCLPAGVLLVSSGNVRLDLRAALINQAFRIIAVVIACPFGLEAIAAGYGISSLLAVAVFQVQLRQAIQLEIRHVAKACWGSLQITVITMALPLVVVLQLGDAFPPVQVVLATGAASACGLLVGLLLIKHPLREELSGVLTFLKKRG